MRIDRMLSITVLLLNRRSITARQLAERFEVSVRTIYRDIEAINRAGIPVVSYQGYGGGYCIMDNYRVSRQLLTLNDMATILSALKGINTTFASREIDSAIDKINSLVPDDKEKEIETRLKQVVLDVLPWGFSEKQQKKLRDIQQATMANTLLVITYRNIMGEVLKRVVEPMTVIFKGNTWYLFAYCRTRKDFRLFRLSRIYTYDRLPDQFERRGESYKNYQRPTSDSFKSVDLVLKFSPKVRVIVEDFFEHETITIEKNGDLIVRASFPEDPWVYATILSYGSFVEVIKPAHIRKIIKEEAQKILKYY